MGKLRACIVVASAALATIVACGSSTTTKKPDALIVVPDAPIDAKAWLDAPPDAAPTFDFSCLGSAAPTTTPNASITVSGSATEVGFNGAPSFTPLAGATVDGCATAGSNCMGSNLLGSAMTGSDGSFTVGPITTNGVPVSAYMRLTPPSGSASGSMDKAILEYPGEPLTANLANVPLITFSPTAIAVLPALGCSQTGSMVAVLVTDCMNNPISDSQNTTVTLTQGGSAVGGTPIDLGNLSSMAAGTYLFCGVPANQTHVAAQYKTMTLLAHDVSVEANTITATQVRPGY